MVILANPVMKLASIFMRSTFCYANFYYREENPPRHAAGKEMEDAGINVLGYKVSIPNYQLYAREH
jgi:hypothetical protein